MFHLISSSPHFIDHVSFLFPSVHSPSHSFHLPQSISFIFTLFGSIHVTCIHVFTLPFSLIVSFTFQLIPYLESNNLQVSLDKFLILDRVHDLKLKSGHTGIPELWTQELDAGLWTLDAGLWTLDVTLRKLSSGPCGQLAQNKIRTQFLNLLIL